jgi:GNAT superfamily N-acetyltransferase
LTVLRPALNGDIGELSRFHCARTAATFELEVEEFVREALGWRAAVSGREVYVLTEDEALVGIVAYEDDDDGIFVNALAVHADRQGTGIGTEMLAAVLRDLAEVRGNLIVSWLVHPANFASHSMSTRVGALAIYPPEDKPFGGTSSRSRATDHSVRSSWRWAVDLPCRDTLVTREIGEAR